LRYNFQCKCLGVGLPHTMPSNYYFLFKVHQRVLKAIKEWDRFPQDRVSKLELDARFVEDLSFDSLDLVEIVMSLEDEFGFEISIEVILFCIFN